MGDGVLGSSRRGDGADVVIAADQGRAFLDLATSNGTYTQFGTQTKVDTVTVKCRTPALHDLGSASGGGRK